MASVRNVVRMVKNNSIGRKFAFAIRFFTTKRVMDSASALTYSTILSLVPVCAVIFSIARGFGYTVYIEQWFRNVLSSQPQAAEFIIGFVNSYLEHTKSGVILGIGLLFMLYTIVMLTRNVEQSFNDIWHVENRRSVIRTFTDYLSIFFLIPLVIIIMSGVSLFIGAIAAHSQWEDLLGPVAQVVIDMIPFLLMWLAFTALYVFMPNTKVKLTSAVAPGLLAAMAMSVLQWFYIHAQMFISNYNAIYGSFAALPLFMLWVQFSWLICLFGAELSYTNQNLEDFAFSERTLRMSHRDKTLLSVFLLGKICRRFDNGQPPYTDVELKEETHIPLSIVRDLLGQMRKAGILTEIIGRKSQTESHFQPAMSPDRITVGFVVKVLDAHCGQEPPVDTNVMFKDLDAYKDIREQYERFISSLSDIRLKDT